MIQSDLVAMIAIIPILIGIALLVAVLIKAIKKPKLSEMDRHNLEVAKLKRAKKAQKAANREAAKKNLEEQKAIEAIWQKSLSKLEKQNRLYEKN